jgi:hypothetical protein
VVPISRYGVDVITMEGLPDALDGVESVVDAATWPTPEEKPATEFFTTSARNLQTLGERRPLPRRAAARPLLASDHAPRPLQAVPNGMASSG